MNILEEKIKQKWMEWEELRKNSNWKSEFPTPEPWQQHYIEGFKRLCNIKPINWNKT